jgi:predicted Rossmann-fold nucleotide-binding protein
MADLLGGWTADDPLSYGRTLDARTYRDAVVSGLRTPTDPAEARRRALHDHEITLALNALVKDRQVVAFMGGYRLPRGGDAYRMVADIAQRLSGRGYVIVSGGGPGAMEAALLGARLARAGAAPGDLDEALAILAKVPTIPANAGHLVHDDHFDDGTLAALHTWQVPAFAVADRWPDGPDQPGPAGEGVGVPTWLYGHEPPCPLATVHAKYFENSIREDGLLAIAKAGVVFAEGSAGTLQEVFQDAAQNHYASVDGTRSPMVFLDLDKFWTVQRPVETLLRGLLDDDAERLLHFVTTADDAVAAIEAGDDLPTPDLVSPSFQRASKTARSRTA